MSKTDVITKDANKLKVYENKVMRRMFVCKREEVI
jgi:hypothetical protein